MKFHFLSLGLGALCAPFLAQAQCTGVQTPANLLAGQTFVFRLNKSGLAFNNTVSAVGRFTTQPGGYVSVVETVIDVSSPARGEVIYRLAPASGRWMVNNDCLTGMITLMLNREPFVLNFVLLGGGTTILLTGRDESGAFNYPSNLRTCAQVGTPRKGER